MADKKIYGPQGKIESAEINQDFKDAKDFAKLKIGRLGVYYKENLRLKFLPFDFIERAFIRIHEAKAVTCCSCTSYNYYSLEFVHDGREYKNVLSESESLMDEALAYIHELAPAVAIGYEKKA